MTELVRLPLHADADVPRARHVAHCAAQLLGLGPQDQTRVATAVSEVARATFAQGWGHLRVSLDRDDAGYLLVCEAETATAPAVQDDGVRIVGRLVDALERTEAGLRLVKRLPLLDPPTEQEVQSLQQQLSVEPDHPLVVLRAQNRELAQTLVLLRERESDLMQLNEELAETNRGVVALYGELENSAEQVRNAQRQVFTELEAALRPPPPAVPGVELAVRYLPAQTNSPTGGDLYDWLPLADGSLHITIVDVEGHGVQSTRTALDVTHALRTLSREGHPLGELVARTDQLVGSGDRSATVLLARFDPYTGRLELAGGGHPPALLVRANGDTEYLEAPGLPIGYPLSGSDGTTTAVLEAGDALLLYTDGLIELRRNILVGMQALLLAPRSAPDTPVDGLLDHVLHQVGAGQGLRDDTLLLGLRRTSLATAEPRDELSALRGRPVLRLTVPANPRNVRTARQGVATACAAWGLGRDVQESAELVVSELVTNAVLHGGDGPVELCLLHRPAGVRVEVTDTSPHTPSFGAGPSADAESGRGLVIVQSLATRWGTSAEAGFKTVWAHINDPHA